MVHRHLVIGAVPPPTGGATVLLEQLLSEARQSHVISMSLISTSVQSSSILAKVAALIGVLCVTAIRLPRHDSVSFHGSVTGLSTFGPLLCILARLYKKPLVFRAFGGDLDIKYSRSSRLVRAILNGSFQRCSALLLETHHLVTYFGNVCTANIVWYPNSRPQIVKRSEIDGVLDSASKFVFIGHVNRSKGVLDLVAAFEQLPKQVVLHIYGPLGSCISRAELRGANIVYHGAVDSSKVGDVLSEMDVLVLPTSWEGEGYPGVILEAYSFGLPVVSTEWRSIPEIVYSGSGILYQPGDIAGLVSSIQAFCEDPKMLASAKKSAIGIASELDSTRWTKAYVSLVIEL